MTSTSTPVHTTTVTPRPATEPGALDGFAINCSACGFVGSYSIRCMSDELARKHVTYMASVGR